jgi:hypothetical protein
MFNNKHPRRPGYQTLWRYITNEGKLHHTREVWMHEDAQGRIDVNLKEVQRQYPSVVRVVIDIAL